MKSTFIKYSILIITIIVITEILNYILDLKGLLYNSLSGKFTNNQIKYFLESQSRLKWIYFIFIPIFLTIKFFLIASILYIGTFFLSKIPINFNQLWAIVINSEYIFLLFPVCKIIWFYFFQANYTLEDVQFFYPLSALNIIDYKDLSPWFIYPLQTINLFEFAYIIYLAYQIGNLTKTNTDTGLKIVASSYIPALFLWVFIVMFFTLNFS